MSDTKAAAEIRALEEKRFQAMRDADIVTLEALLSDRLLYTHSNASVDTKKSYLDKVKSKFFDYLEIDSTEHSIVATGDVVFVFGRMTGRVLMQGAERRLNNRTLGAWARENGAWRFIAFQPTPILAPA